MCYDASAHPPSPEGSPGHAAGQGVELVSSGGAQFAAYIARATLGQTAKANIVIFPDAGGLDRYYKELAMRFAEQGIDAIAIDYFGRTAGVAPRDASFDKLPYIQQLQFPTLLADAQAAITYLRNGATIRTSTFTVGFCLGGALSLLTAAQDLPLAGAICLYAVVERPFQGMEGTALDRSVNIRVPVLGLFGGADQYIAPEVISRLEDKLDTGGVEHEIVTYPGAPHSFFDRKFTEYAQESADAWRRILELIGKHTK